MRIIQAQLLFPTITVMWKKEFYEEGLYVGYRYFDTFGIPVRYGFGYGLSYTTFEIQNASIKKEQTNLLKVSMSVKNTGAVAGKEVVQAYASLPGGSMEKEAHRLIAYAKTELLQPGEEQSTRWNPAECLTSYDEKKQHGFWKKDFMESSLETAWKVQFDIRAAAGSGCSSGKSEESFSTKGALKELDAASQVQPVNVKLYRLRLPGQSSFRFWN